jgi:threonyl-tRNA synthetase
VPSDEHEVRLRFPDGSVKGYPEGVCPLDIALEISPGLARAAVGSLIGDLLWELNRPLPAGEHGFRLVTFDDPEGREFYWHTAAHVLATAVQALYPKARFGIGPAIDNGFYYDFLVEKPFAEEDLGAIEDKMREIIAADLPLVRRVVSRDEARAEMERRGETLKVELIDELPPEAEVTFYSDGDFVDLCKGPHLPSTGRLGVVKLLSVAGAYWRGDERRPMLSRIYGAAFPKSKQLDLFLEGIEEAKRRDHRKLGAEMELFSIAENYGPGLILYHPAGATLHYEIERLAHEMHRARGYELVHTPHVFRADLWKISGHYEHYKDNMFFARLGSGEAEYAVKPMNCPGHVLIYSHGLHSYRELPVRYYEFGHVYRNELSGVLHGLMRVRGFTIDDAHIFCTPAQLEDEIVGVIRFAQAFMGVFGLPMSYSLATRPPDAMGSVEIWIQATTALEHALTRLGVPYVVDSGGGAFYGPKIDINVTDALGRKWQTTTCQVDFNFPERFDLSYVGEDGARHRVVMVHRAVLGSFERFIGVLIEHFAGNFPLWLAPEQVRVLPVAEVFVGYAEKVADRFREKGLRVRVDAKDSKLGAKIASAETAKVKYTVVVGKAEAEAGDINLRPHGKKAFNLSLSEALDGLVKENDGRLLAGRW